MTKGVSDVKMLLLNYWHYKLDELRDVLGGIEGLTLRAERVETADPVVQILREFRPDVVLLDGLDFEELKRAVRAVKTEYPFLGMPGNESLTQAWVVTAPPLHRRLSQADVCLDSAYTTSDVVRALVHAFLASEDSIQRAVAREFPQ